MPPTRAGLSFRFKLIATFLAIAVIPLLLLCFKGYADASRSDIEAMGRTVKTLAEETIDKIDRNLFERYGDVQAFAINPYAIDGTQEQVTAAANKYATLYGIYDVLLIADAAGNVFAINTEDRNGKPLATQELIGTTVRNEPWFIACTNGSMKPGATFTMDVHRDERAARLTGDNGLVIGFAAPIRDAEGKVVRVWLNLASRERIIGEITSDERKHVEAQLGLIDSEVQAIDRTGLLIDGSAAEASGLLTTNLASDLQAAKKIVSGEKSGFVVEGHPGRSGNPDYINGFAASKGALGFSGLGMGVVVRAPLTSVVASARDNLVLKLIFTAILAAFIAAIAWWIANGIAKPLVQLETALTAVAGGDLRPRLDIKRSDEIGRMGTTFNQAMSGLETALGAIGGHARSLAGSAGELTGTSERMNAAAETTSSQSATVSASAGQIGTSVATVATGMEEMSAAIAEIARGAQDGARIADEAAQVARTTGSTMEELNKASAEIGSIIQVITTIAGQTNLLALNATIEAARAGDAGKGFAVVASEVKELARVTAQSSADIAGKTKAIQDGIATAVTAIGQITTIIARICETTQTIASAVEEQSATTNEIGSSIGEVAKGAQAIAQNVSGVSAAAQSTASGAADTNSAAKDLALLASQLQTLVQRFQLSAKA